MYKCKNSHVSQLNSGVHVSGSLVFTYVQTAPVLCSVCLGVHVGVQLLVRMWNLLFDRYQVMNFKILHFFDTQTYVTFSMRKTCSRPRSLGWLCWLVQESKVLGTVLAARR